MAISGEHSVQFASDDDCEFFVAAYRAVPALLDEIETLKRTIDDLAGGSIEAMRQEIARLRAELSGIGVRNAMLENQLTQEAAGRAAAEKRARAGAVVARKTVGLVSQIETLQKELEAARATNVK